MGELPAVSPTIYGVVMSEFLLLFRGGDPSELQKNEAAWKEHMDRWAAWMGGLAEKGQFTSAQPLSRDGKVVRSPEMVVTDGPYVEGKEFVTGYMLFKANDIAHATEISKRCPILEMPDGIVEVREVTPIDM
jgi:hypothetical protein